MHKTHETTSNNVNIWVNELFKLTQIHLPKVQRKPKTKIRPDMNKAMASGFNTVPAQDIDLLPSNTSHTI